MLTVFKQIFIWWNHQTIGTRIYTFLFGKFIGKDEYGNKYYQSKKGRRWVIYNGEVEATKIPNEWYSWIHFTNNKIENLHNIKKYVWQKPHTSNRTGSKDAYRPDKKSNKIQKKYKSWKE